jgi:hypothetical protein
MHNVHHSVCGVIPPHILRRVAEAPGGDRARATLEQMREMARARTGASWTDCTARSCPAV